MGRGQSSTITFSGTIEYYESDPSTGITSAGNYVGVQITAPTEAAVDEDNATFTYTDTSGVEVTLVNCETEWTEITLYIIIHWWQLSRDPG